jgi:hypothetical protein
MTQITDLVAFFRRAQERADLVIEQAVLRVYRVEKIPPEEIARVSGLSIERVVSVIERDARRDSLTKRPV